VILNPGRIEQVGSPLELYEFPTNQFVAGFLGSPQMNFLPVTVEAQRAEQIRCRSAAVGSLTLPIRVSQPLEGKNITLGIRPEHVHLGAQPGAVMVPGVVNIVENLGSETFAHVEVGENAVVVAKGSVGTVPERNHRTQLGIAADHLYLFGEDEMSIPLEARAA
jgi:multiple sugar transport system ATP-binding protein